MSEQRDSSLVLGIDLGTTNSLAAVPGNKGPKVLRDATGDPLIPSVVTLLDDGTVLVGAEAKALSLTHPARTIHSIKRLIGRAGPEVDTEAARLPYPVRQGERGLARVIVDGQELSPEEISALVLRKLRDMAINAIGIDQPANRTADRPVNAVITVPAYFDDAQRQATKDAAQLAGLNCLRLLNEPTAASLAYGIDGSKDGTILVYDLGGGTFDVSILKIHDGVFRVLATAGNTHLGGDDFDQLLVQRILGTFNSADDGAASPSPLVMQTLRQSAEGLKIRLSEHDEAELSIALGSDRSSELKITRAEFEAMIRPLVNETLDSCRQALNDAELSFAELDEVVLVGGSTRIPLVRRALEELTGRQPHSELDPDQVVAMGAALQAGVLSGTVDSMLLLDVVPLSLGLETLGGVVNKLILRNSTIPTTVTEEFSTQVDNQTGVDLNIYQGEREKIEDCRRLASFKLGGIPPMPAGLPRVAVTFLVDADGVLQVHAKEQRTGAEASIQVLPSFGLTREEVSRIMHESIEHAGEDMAAREAVELRNKGNALVRGTRQALSMSELPPDQSWPIQQAVKKLEAVLQTANASSEELKVAADDVSKLTAQVADDVISTAISKALSGPQSGPQPGPQSGEQAG